VAKSIFEAEDSQPLIDHLAADEGVFKATIPKGTPISGKFRGKQAVATTSRTWETSPHFGSRSPWSSSAVVSRFAERFVLWRYDIIIDTNAKSRR
jgi:hypothetical protein